MKHNQILRRGLGILLSLVLCLGLLPATALAEGEDAEVSPKAIQLGADCISGYDSETGYDYLYYGYWNSDDTKAYSGPIKWLVLDDQTNTGADGLFLLSEAVLGSGDYGNVYFNQSAHKADGIWYKGAEHDGGHENCQLANAWQGSDGQAWCRDFYGSSLTEQEQAAVLATTKSDGEYGTYWFSRYILFSASDDILKDDTVFFLSTEEAENGAYGFPDNASRSAVYTDGQDTRWWLRSPLSEGTVVGVVHTKGVVATWIVYSDWAARPAFNLDPDAVVFASAAEGRKSTDGMNGSLTAVADYTGNEWKLTLKDSDRDEFAASTTEISGDTVTVRYKNAITGANEYISAIVRDEYGSVSYYGRIAQLDGTTNTASGTVEIDLSGINMTGKTLCVFNEQYNGDKMTDYASALCTLSLSKSPTIDSMTPTTKSLTASGGDVEFTITGTNLSDGIVVKATDEITATTSGTDMEQKAVLTFPANDSTTDAATYTVTNSLDDTVTASVTVAKKNSMLNFFVDVPAGAYYYDAVLWAAENGIIGGVDDTHFAPNVTCTRAQAVTFLWRAAGSPAPKSSEMPFEDVAAGSYYYDAVLWAVENGITKGTSDTTFSPNADCTRAQAMAFIWRSQKSVAADGVNPFTDVAADAYYAGAVQWAVENGVTNGTSDTTFSPNTNCTRAHIVTFLYRCLGEE